NVVLQNLDNWIPSSNNSSAVSKGRSPASSFFTISSRRLRATSKFGGSGLLGGSVIRRILTAIIGARHEDHVLRSTFSADSLLLSHSLWSEVCAGAAAGHGEQGTRFPSCQRQRDFQNPQGSRAWRAR